MNIQNIDKAIAIMERATNLNMEQFQSKDNSNLLVNTIEELHACGNTACFAGYIAISDEFKADGGGYIVNDGCPVYNGSSGSRAISEWLEISAESNIAHCFVYGKTYFANGNRFSQFYNKLWSEVTPSDVIEKLKELKELGEEAFIEKYIAIM